MQQLAKTLHDLTAADLIAYYPPPTPGSTLQQGSTDPAVYVNDPSYIKLLNEQAYWRYAVDVPNRQAADRFSFQAKQWEMNKSIFLPAPPRYVIFDTGAYDQWWAQLQTTYDQTSPNYGNNAPPLFFVKPAPLPPDPLILSEGVEGVVAPKATDGPIGLPYEETPGVPSRSLFHGSASDNFSDGYIYAGPTGIYQKHQFSNPFSSGNVRIVWMKLG